MRKISVKYFKGQDTEGQASDFWTEKDWENHRKSVEKCKKDGSYGSESEVTLELRDDFLFSSTNKLVLDLDNIEIFKFKPLTQQ